jgi:aspartate ammonia-lyase
MKTAQSRLSKICNDLRWLSSGPRVGSMKSAPACNRVFDHAGKVNPLSRRW